MNDICIAIFPLACQLEHACRPNAMVVTDSLHPEQLQVKALSQPIRPGAPVTFCYLSEDYDGIPLADAVPYATRRVAIAQELGFECQCADCTRERDRETG